MDWVSFVSVVVMAELMSIDFWQTITAMKQGRREKNPLVFGHPSTGELIAYAVISFSCKVVVACFTYRFVSPDLGVMWLFIMIGLSLYCVFHNHRAGIKIQEVLCNKAFQFQLKK